MGDKKAFAYVVENIKEIFPQYLSNGILLMVPTLDTPDKKYFRSYNTKKVVFDILVVELKKGEVTINPQLDESF